MKYLIASDIHGSAYWTERLVAAIESEQPDRIVLLGDLLYHGPRNDLPRDYAPKRVIPLLNALADRIIAVRGNCDFGADEPELRLLNLGNVRILMVHGHRYAVKSSLLRLSLLSQEHRADITLYGHTHRQDAQWVDQRLVMCPGSVGGARGSYAVLEVGNGRYDFVLKNKEDLQP